MNAIMDGGSLMWLTPGTLDPGAEALSQEFHGPEVWWLHGAALGLSAVQCRNYLGSDTCQFIQG